MGNNKPPEKDDFFSSGPLQLTCVDWTTLEHKGSVAASLVKGVYVLEGDRQQKRSGDKALAPTWWKFFEFKCIKVLADKNDSSAFGAIFEYKPNNNCSKYSMKPKHKLPPSHVIAFRGTLLKSDTWVHDFLLDIQLPLPWISQRSRCKSALKAVQWVINRDSANVWLAGHSLGAAIALFAGKEMLKMGYHIETYLFNPPFLALPIEKLKNPYLKTGIRILRSVVTAGLSLVMNFLRKDSSSQQYDPFSIQRSWNPYIFVDPRDLICCEYIGYFEHREWREGWGVRAIERHASKNSIINLLSAAFGGYGEVLHLTPSAFVTKNMVSTKRNTIQAHGLHHWWQPHPYSHSKLYRMKD